MLGPVLARVRKGALNIPLRVLYPVFAVTDESRGRGVVFHHGHYCEPVYHFMSKARRWFFPEREQPATACDVYNSGGWVVDSRDATPAVGASIILVSEGLEVVSVRLFSDGLREGDLSMDVRVAAGGPADPPGEPSEFAGEVTQRMRGGIADNPVAPPWHRLGEQIREAVLVRRGYLEHQFPRNNV